MPIFCACGRTALLSDDYYPSDLAWLDLKNPKFDVIFAPYETYDDHLLGVKATYGAAVMIRNAEQSKKLEMFENYVADIQDALPLPPEDRPSKRGLQTPMEVMDSPYRAGDLRHGYQAVADNLPNDPRIHEQKGSKKIFFKNFMDARVDYVILPLARYMMVPEQAAKASGEGYLLSTIMHEISHGLGPAYARTAARQGGHPRSHRPGLQRAGRSQGGCGRNVWPEVAGGPRRVCRKTNWRNITHRTWRGISAPFASAPEKRTARRR